MDTHIANHPDIQRGAAGISARLPGETYQASAAIGGLEAGKGAPSPTVKPRRRRRKILLAGVAVAAVAIAGGAILVSPYNTLYPVPRLQASVTNAARNAETDLHPILAFAASLAKVKVPPPPPATRDGYTPKPRDQEVAEVVSLHPGHADPAGGSGAGSRPTETADHATVTPAGTIAAVPAASDAPSGYVPREPGSSGPRIGAATASSQVPATSRATPTPAPASSAATAPSDATARIVASLPTNQPATPDTQAAPTPAAAQPTADPVSASNPPAASAAAPRPDAVAVAMNLRAAPMSPPEQVQVLNLVTQLATMVKDLRKEQAQLRADLKKSSSDVSARLTDHERRLALAEARSALGSADEATAGTPAKSVEPARDPAAVTPAPIPVAATRPIAVVPSPLVPSAPKIYRVQAASPGLALLAQVDRGGGDGAQIQVVVGDIVPDYGRVKSIAQKGTVWVVTTEHGAIQ